MLTSAGKKEVRRRHKQVPVTTQTPLFPGVAEAHHPEGRGRAARFEKPDPEQIFIGGTPLRQYLCAHDLQWVIALREQAAKCDLREIRETYSPRGRRPIDPAILVGLTLYGMLRGQWSLRDLEGLSLRDVAAWWICGGVQPDHSTLGYFLHRHAGFLTEEFFLKLTRQLLKELKSKPGVAALDSTVFEAVGSHYRTLKAEAAREAEQAAAAAGVSLAEGDDRTGVCRATRPAKPAAFPPSWP